MSQSLKDQTQAAAEVAVDNLHARTGPGFTAKDGEEIYLDSAYNAPTILRAIEALNEIKKLSNDKCAIQLAHEALKEIQEAREVRT